MLCAVRRHQSLNTSICLDPAPFDSPPFPVQILPKINGLHNPHSRAGISFRKVDSNLNIQLQSNFKQICCLFTQIRAAGSLSHVSKDESFSGLDPVKPRPKYKKPADQGGETNISEGEYIEQSHANYRLEHALKSLRVGIEQQSKDSPLSSYPQEFTAASSSNPSTPPPEALHQLTCASSVSAPNTRFTRQNHEGPLPAPSQPLSLQTETIDKITTLNSHLYDPGSVDSTRSTPTESLSTTSSPVLKQAHPQLFPDNYIQGERRDSVVSLESTLAPSSPRPRGNPRPSQGDAVLISFLAPDQPHIAIKAGESPLPWPSGSDSTEAEMETESGDHDRPGGSDSDNNSGNMSRQQSSEGLRGNGNMGSGNENTTNGGAAKGGDGGGDERKGNSGDGEKGKGDGGSGSDDKDNDKEKDKKKKAKDKEQLTSDTDAMDIDESSEEKPTKSKTEDEAKDNAAMGRKDSNAMDVEVSSSETAVSSLMALAGAAGKDQQSSSSGSSLPAMFPTAGGGTWAPTAHAQTSPSTDRAPPPQPPAPLSPGSSNLFKLPLPNSPTSLPSIMNSQSASSPNSLPPGNDGRHTTLPPVSSIHVLADIAEKESSHQQQSSWGNTRMPPNSRTVYPTVSSHVSVAPSNRSAQAAQSPGLPPPAQAAHGYGPDGNPRPPMHHMSLQQRQYYLSQESPPSPYYPHHPHQHYQSPYPPIKEGGNNGSSGSYSANFTHGRELPGIMSSPPPTANFFAQPHMPSTIGGRRDSTLDPYYSSEHTPPSGPSTGDTMTSSGTDDTVTSPRNRSMPAGGQQGGALAAGVFKCEFPSCKAQPFQTQYLLNSHANVHSSARPHYCPVKGCSRAEGGKGFKRKNEMIRHGLVHDSPGYVCPFCPDREHKYPRPDNLQRHVRVHHMDKDKDDPLLRDVLSQRPEGGNRGRRRRLGA